MALQQQLDAAIANGIAHLETKLTCQVHSAKTHRAVVVEGWGADATAIDAVAAYLVGILASAVSQALAVRSQIEDTPRDRLELVKNVEALVGSATDPLTDEQKQDERNPWIAEGLWHMCLYLASRRTDLHPPGRVLALDLPHVAAKDHGFDVVALYESTQCFGLSFVESKAYEKNPNKAISDAVSFFRDLDRGEHDVRARQVNAALRSSLPPARQPEVSPSLWKDSRTYLPNPHYDSSSGVDWNNTRPSFRELKVKQEQVVVMPHAIPGFRKFFDDVGAAMLALAVRVSNV